MYRTSKNISVEAVDSIKVYTPYDTFFVRKTLVEKTDTSRF
jgi:hypothetical protein